MRILRGKVRSGVGNLSYWLEKLNQHYLRKTGLNLFPGTLNVELEETYSLPEKVIRLQKEELGGTVSVNIVPCRIFNLEAVILRTDNAEYGQGLHPKTIVEIACEVKLREQFNLSDGDIVEVEVPE